MEKCRETFKEVPEDIFVLNEASTNKRAESEVIGGIFSDSKSAWMALGPFLQVFYIHNAQLRSVWCFGTLAKEEHAHITCIEEIKFPLVAVGLKYGQRNGMVCIYNTSCASVLRAIEVPEEVTSLQIISNGFDATLFPGPLAAFDGILTVGTTGGAVFIMDLSAESLNEIHDELNPCRMHVLSIADVVDLERRKTKADIEGQQLAVLLNERETRGQYFELKTPQGRNVIFAAKEEVTVSRLQYGPQLCSLIVGYNFGALQIWDCITMRLVFTSTVYEEKIPVAFIAIQEPIDDPLATCYFWAVYSCAGQGHNSFPMAALYALSYDSKEYHEGYGHLYQNLQCCAVRFQTNLQTMISMECKSSTGADCIRLQAFHKGHNSPQSVSSPDACHTLCMMSWNVVCEDHKVHTYLSLFDLNQWYKEEMPRAPHRGQHPNFMTTLNITEMTSMENFLLDVAIKPGSIHAFEGVQNMEEHYRPSALGYNVCVMSSIETCRFTKLPVQNQFFRKLDEAGPLALMHPENLYETILSTGLSPLFLDSPAIVSMNAQREALLSTALERRKLQWLCKCAVSWGNGSHRSVGLSLEFLLNWAWERTRALKHNADRFCTNLFDYSGHEIDKNVSALLISCRGQFATLRDLYRFIMKNCATFLSHPDIAEQQLDWLQRNYEYFNVIGWMVNLRILPETKENYPFEVMRDHYAQRRNRLKAAEGIDPKCKHYLLIDQLTHNLQEEEWGDAEYPPASIQSLLRCYFNRHLCTKRAHMIIAYTLLNLQHNYDGNIAAAMIKFPQIFDLTMSQTKLVQSLWQFDHGQTQAAITQLSNTLIRFEDIGEEQHRNIIALLKLQKEYNLALRYWKSRNVKDCKEDVKNLLELHVRNNLLYEAVCIARRYGDSALLETFFNECVNAGVFLNIVNINFSKEEEQMLLQYMINYNYPKREDFKTMYYVRRGRYLDFYLHHEKNTPKNIVSNMVRTCLDGMLPKVTRKIIGTCMELRNFEHNEQPKPLSALMCDAQERAKFGNDFLKATIVNCKPMWTRSKFMSEDDFPLMRPPFPTKRSEIKNVVFPRRVSHLMRHIPNDVEIEQSSKRRRLSGSASRDEFNMTTIPTLHVNRNESSSHMNIHMATATHSILKTPSSYSDNAKTATPTSSSRRLPFETSSVRFSGISKTPEEPLSINDNPEMQNEDEMETSTLSGYQSAQQSPDSICAKRKRNLSENEDGKNISILRSKTFNIEPHAAKKLFESSRGTSFVAELLPATADEIVEPINESVAVPEEHKPTLFVFTGRDEHDLSTTLLPKARNTYQKIANTDKLAKDIETLPVHGNESTLVDGVFTSESSRVVRKTQSNDVDEMEVDVIVSNEDTTITHNLPMDSKSITTSSTSYKTALDGTSKFSNASEKDEKPRQIHKLVTPLLSHNLEIRDLEKDTPETSSSNNAMIPKDVEESDTLDVPEICFEKSISYSTPKEIETNKREDESESTSEPAVQKSRPNWVNYFADSPAKVSENNDEKTIKKFVTSYAYGASPNDTRYDVQTEENVSKPGRFDITRKSLFEKSSYINYFADSSTEDEEPDIQITSKVEAQEDAKQEDVGIYEDLSNMDDAQQDVDLQLVTDEVEEDDWIRTIHHSDVVSEVRCVSTVQRNDEEQMNVSEGSDAKDAPVEVISIHSTTTDESAESGSKAESGTDILELGFIAETESEAETSEIALNEAMYLPALATIPEEPTTPSRRRRSTSVLSGSETPRRRSLRLLQSPLSIALRSDYDSASETSDKPKPKAKPVSRTRRVSADAPALPARRSIRTRSVDAIEEIKKTTQKPRKIKLDDVAEVSKPTTSRRRTKSYTPDNDIDLLSERRMTRNQLKLMQSNESILNYSTSSIRSQGDDTVFTDTSLSPPGSTGRSNVKTGKGRAKKLKTVDNETRRVSARQQSLRSNMSTISEEVDVEPRRITRSRRSSTAN